MYLKIVNYHSINMVQFFYKKNLKGINPTSKDQVFDCISTQEDFHMRLSQQWKLVKNPMLSLSIHLSFSFFIYLSIYLSIYRSKCNIAVNLQVKILSFQFKCLAMYISLYVSIYRPTELWWRHHVQLASPHGPACVYVCLYVCMSACMYVCIYMHIGIYLKIVNYHSINMA